jgi:predicted nucleotidyltransferase component of viral defense system
MDAKIRQAQRRVLTLFAKEATSFALAGGTALELYYLHHRFSGDLDFFSPQFTISEIDRLIAVLKKKMDSTIHLESEMMTGGKARVRFYTMPIKGSERPLKIDFVEDVFFEAPSIHAIEGVRVYSAENIYFQKIAAIGGTRSETDAVGRTVMEGRREARDVYDVYMLSKTIQPLQQFLHTVPSLLQRGMVHWYRTFSRQELKLSLLDMAIYDKQFNSSEMIKYLENEIKHFMREVSSA